MEESVPFWLYSDVDATVKANLIVDGKKSAEFETKTESEFAKSYKVRIPLKDTATSLAMKGVVLVGETAYSLEVGWNIANAAPKTRELRDSSKPLAERLAKYLNDIMAFDLGEPFAESPCLARDPDTDGEYLAKIADIEKQIDTKIPEALRSIGNSDFEFGDAIFRSIVAKETVLQNIRAGWGENPESNWDKDSLALFARSFVVHFHAGDGPVLLGWDPEAEASSRPAWFWLSETGEEYLSDSNGKPISGEAAVLSVLDRLDIHGGYFESLVEEGLIGPGVKATDDDWIIFDASHAAASLQFNLSLDESSSTASLHCVPRLYNST